MSIEELREQRDKAKERLKAALEAGESTTELRAEVQSLTDQMDAIEEAQAEAAAKAAQTDAERIAAAARAMVESARETTHTAILGCFEAIQPNISMDLDFAPAETLLKAEIALSKANAVEAKVGARVAAIRAKIEAMQAERAAIVQRRKQGEIRVDDGARLELLGVDSDGLNELLIDADARLADAKQAVANAEEAVSSAKFRWERAQHAARTRAWQAVLPTLEAAMVAAVPCAREIDPTMKSPFGFFESWYPTDEFKSLMKNAGFGQWKLPQRSF